MTKNLSTCLEKMLSNGDIPERDDFYIVIENDNCSLQYKAAEHFHNWQSIADSLNKKIIHVYETASHEKGEVDHVGGIAKDCHPMRDS